MNKLNIIKIGGNVIEDSKLLDSFLNDFASIKEHKILVHGGGKDASKLAKKLGVNTNIIDGRRITDSSNLEIITMVYGGKINKFIVAKLQGLNCNAIGVSGADCNSITAVKRPIKEIDYGFVGDIDKINTNIFKLLLENKITPVCCAISHDGKGQLLNTNADTIASVLAIELSKLYSVSLLYCFEKKGVLNIEKSDQKILELITPTSYINLKSKGVINSGMIPKIDNCFNALKSGVKIVKIGSPKIIKGNEPHTKVVL
tara:strand:- start:1845 stop:2618 length:774 start_codon:yes stop_codon:yes gene_type:complete